MAEGLAAGNPGRKGDWVLRILRETGGMAGQAEDDEILAAQKMLAREEGILIGYAAIFLGSYGLSAFLVPLSFACSPTGWWIPPPPSASS